VFQNPRYVQNSFSLAFPRQQTIRRKANDFEDRLAGMYFQPHIIPVPDDIDPEFPRMIFGSEHGFSKIIISQINITLVVTYSPEWQVDIPRGRAYLLERAPVLFCLLGVLGVDPYYCGLGTRVRLASSAPDNAILDQLARQFLTIPDVEDLHELLIKLTRVVSCRFFSHLAIQNYRSWATGVGELGAVPLPIKQTSERGVQLIGDINDRYAFNETPGYRSSENAAREIINLGLEEIQSMVVAVGGHPS
jgi:hypothetical protein